MSTYSVDDHNLEVEKFRLKLLQKLRRDYPLIIWDVISDSPYIKMEINTYPIQKEYFVIRTINNSVKLVFNFCTNIPSKDFSYQVNKSIEKDIAINIRKIVKQIKDEARKRNVAY